MSTAGASAVSGGARANLTRMQPVEVNLGMRRTRHMVTGVAAMLALGLVTAGCNFSKTGAVAPNAPDMVTVLPTVGGQTTSVTVDPGTASALGSLGVSLRSTGSATQQGSVVTFPITSGYVEVHSRHDAKPGWIDGSLTHAGSGLDLVGLGATVHLSDFVVDPGNSVLDATVNGKTGVPLLSLDGTKVTATTNDAGQVVLRGHGGQADRDRGRRPGPGVRNHGGDGRHAPRAGPGRHLRLHVHLQRLPGPRHRHPQPDGHVDDPDRRPAVLSTLASSGLSLTPTGSATAANTRGGDLPDHGRIRRHPHRPRLLAGLRRRHHRPPGQRDPASGRPPRGSGPSVTLSDFVVDPGDSVLTGTVNGEDRRPPVLPRRQQAVGHPHHRGCTLDGTVAELTGVAAGALDKAFGTQAFTAGMAVGTVHLVATGS